MAIIADEKDAKTIVELLKGQGEQVYEIGKLVPRSGAQVKILNSNVAWNP